MPIDQGVPASGDNGLAVRFYDLVMGDDEARLCCDIPDHQCQEQPASFTYQVTAQALSKIGDGLTDSKVVLPWLLGAVGAPAFLVGLLVPIRESFALIPQILFGGLIRGFPVRKGFWIAGSVIEGVCITSMGLVALAGLRGATAGTMIVALLVLFSLARSIASIAAKDTLGKTVSKGKRGRVSGHAATLSGLVTGAVGVYLALGPERARPEWLLYALLITAGMSWFVAAVAFSRINEQPGATDGGRGLGDLIQNQASLLRTDTELQKFLLARALMLSIALTGPIYVSLAQRGLGQALDTLGWLIVASGLAGAVSSSFWGVIADRSSRLTMALAAGLAGVLGMAVLGVIILAPSLIETPIAYAAILFTLGVAHAGVRIGRKTHIVDLAGKDQKSEYVALSNTIIGLFLLALGAFTAPLLAFNPQLLLATLSALALVGAVFALVMKHVQN